MTADEPPNGHSQMMGECRFLAEHCPMMTDPVRPVAASRILHMNVCGELESGRPASPLAVADGYGVC
jgi:hypothetical protein